MHGVIEIMSIALLVLWLLLIFGCGFCYGTLFGVRRRSQEFRMGDESYNRLWQWYVDARDENHQLRDLVVRLDPYRELPRTRTKKGRV